MEHEDFPRTEKNQSQDPSSGVPCVPIVQHLSLSDEQANTRYGEIENRINVLEGRLDKHTQRMEYLNFAMVVIASVGVFVAIFQSIIVQKQFVTDQRPLVSSTPKITKFSPNEVLAVDMQTWNYGKSPAVSVSAIGKVFLGRDAVSKAYQWFETTQDDQFAKLPYVYIPPGATASNTSEAKAFEIKTDRVVSAEEFELLLKKEIWAVFVLRQLYRDLAGNAYLTDICFIVNELGDVGYCDEHNHAR